MKKKTLCCSHKSFKIKKTSIRSWIRSLVFKKLVKVIKFNQKAWLKPYIDMNTKILI